MVVGWRPSRGALAGGAQGAFRGVGRQLDVIGSYMSTIGIVTRTLPPAEDWRAPSRISMT